MKNYSILAAILLFSSIVFGIAGYQLGEASAYKEMTLRSMATKSVKNLTNFDEDSEILTKEIKDKLTGLVKKTMECN